MCCVKHLTPALCFGLFLGIKPQCNSFKSKQAGTDLTQRGFHSSCFSPTHDITGLTIKEQSVQI